MKTVAIVGTFDTKGDEFLYVKNQLEKLGLQTLTIHCGIFDPEFVPNITNSEVTQEVDINLSVIAERHDRAIATEAMTNGVRALLPRLYREGRFDGVISMGGSGGSAIATAGMRELPLGVPKIMVSTMASGDVSAYVGASDIMMMPSIVDVEGINSFSSIIFNNAVAAMAGMLQNEIEPLSESKPLIAATMFGVTTPCIQYAEKYLQDKGYEVLVFHATGAGGKCMENLVKQGIIAGVLDLTTTEWCDELFDGVLNAGPDRLSAAALNGVPAVVSVGALDMINFGPYDTVPKEHKDRNLYRHNPSVTLMRTTKEENTKLGEKIAEKLNTSTGPCVLALPLKGVSMIDLEGQAFYGPEEDEALFAALREDINPKKVDIKEYDMHINDKEFAEACSQTLIDLIESHK